MRKSAITLGLVFVLSAAGAAQAPSSETTTSVTAQTMTVDTGGATGRPTRRHLLGLSGLAMVGTVIFFRMRRPLTI